MPVWKNVYLGLGSNLSNPKAQLALAVQLLSQYENIQVIAQAPLFKTPAWGVVDQPDFINSAVHIKTTQSPNQLLTTLKDIEYKQMGRVKNARWHQRLIDIDILLYEKLQIQSKELTIPHPLITDRWFVILPLMLLNPPLNPELKNNIQLLLDNSNPPKDIIRIN